MTSKKGEDHSNAAREVDKPVLPPREYLYQRVIERSNQIKAGIEEFDPAWELTKAILQENDEEIANDLLRWKERGYDISTGTPQAGNRCPTCGRYL